MTYEIEEKGYKQPNRSILVIATGTVIKILLMRKIPRPDENENTFNTNPTGTLNN
jgi:hypothetical protein